MCFSGYENSKRELVPSVLSKGYTHHQLPALAVFLVGRKDAIQFSCINQNYQVRLTPKVLLSTAHAYRSDALKALQ